MSKRWLLRLASAVVVLNLIDALFTVAYTSSHVAIESNPLMQGVLAASPVAFVLTKVVLVSLCVLLLWRHGNRASAILGLLGAAAAYLLIVSYHLSAMPLVISGL